MHFLKDFGQKQCFLGKKRTITLYILCIMFNWICKFAITRKKDEFVAKEQIWPHENFVAIFAFAERLPTFATVIQSVDYSGKSDIVQNRFGCCIT